MTDRDWSKELADIDRQLASLPGPSAAPEQRAPGKAPAAQAPAPQRGRLPHWGVTLRLVLSVALGVGILFWPYEARCGSGLALYLGALIAVIGSGVWSAIWSWRHRAGRSHILALSLIMWGLVLGSLEILPRAGYAKPDARHPATWACR